MFSILCVLEKDKMYIMILTLFLECVCVVNFKGGSHRSERYKLTSCWPRTKDGLGHLSLSTLRNQGMMVYRGRGFLGLSKNKTHQLYFEYLYKSSKDRGSQHKSLVCELSTPNSW